MLYIATLQQYGSYLNKLSANELVFKKNETRHYAENLIC